MSERIDIVALSPLAAQIVDLVGLDAALNLFERYGGVRVYIPERVEPDHPLAQLLGMEAAQALSEHFAGEYLGIPNAKGAARAVRDAGIIDEHVAGRSVRDLALAHRLTERRIYHILAASRSIDDAQASLF